MPEDRSTAVAAGLHDASAPGDATPADAYPQLRRLGGCAYQLQAAARAADHYLAQGNAADRDTGSWLISSAFAIADALAADLDALAKGLRDRPVDTALGGDLRPLRTRAHQLQAATRAADHFLEQDNAPDRSTGSWLIAYASGLSEKLAAELDDLASSLRRPGDGADLPAAFVDVAPGRRSGFGGSLRDIAAA